MAEKKKTFSVIILPERCKACGLCREVCRENVYEESSEINKNGYRVMAVAKPEACIGCLRCLMTCPDFSIVIDEVAV